MEQHIPVMNALGYYSLSSGAYLSHAAASGDEAEWLYKHSLLQYNNLFDGENRNETFFGRYLNAE